MSLDRFGDSIICCVSYFGEIFLRGEKTVRHGYLYGRDARTLLRTAYPTQSHPNYFLHLLSLQCKKFFVILLFSVREVLKMQAKICVVSKAMAIAVMLLSCPLQASAELPPFLRLAKEALFIPEAMAEKFAADPLVIQYQKQYEQAKLKPNLGSVPPRPILTPKTDLRDAQKNLQLQRDQLWQASPNSSGPTGSENSAAVSSSNLAGNSDSESDKDENGAEKHAAWVPNLLGKRTINTTNSSESGWSNYAPFGMAIATPSTPYAANSPFFNPQFDGEGMTRGDFLPTSPPLAPASNTANNSSKPGQSSDTGMGVSPSPATAKRIENLVPDAGFLAAAPPRVAKIAPPAPSDQTQTGQSQATKAADREKPLKLAILVFAEGSEKIPENAQLVLQKLATYQKQQHIMLSLNHGRGENDALALARLAAIRVRLAALGVTPDMIRPDMFQYDASGTNAPEKPLKIPPNQIIIFGEPKSKNQKTG